MLKAFETEIEEDPSKHQDLLTFVLIRRRTDRRGDGRRVSELRRFTLKSDFRRIDPQRARIILADTSSNPR